MKENKSIFWLTFWHLRGFCVWESWSGFGVTTKWPNKGWEEEVRRISWLFEKHLPKDWVTDGPCFVAGGEAIVMYAWPKDDPHVEERFAGQQGAPRPTLDELIDKIKGVKTYVGGEEMKIDS